jgi:hypothetical protein
MQHEQFDTDPETPSKPAKKLAAVTKAAPAGVSSSAPSAPAPHFRPAPAPRRRLGERAAPRQSRLGTEVFSAADEVADDGEDEEEDEVMEVDR